MASLVGDDGYQDPEPFWVLVEDFAEPGAMNVNGDHVNLAVTSKYPEAEISFLGRLIDCLANDYRTRWSPYADDMSGVYALYQCFTSIASDVNADYPRAPTIEQILNRLDPQNWDNHNWKIEKSYEYSIRHFYLDDFIQPHGLSYTQLYWLTIWFFETYAPGFSWQLVFVCQEHDGSPMHRVIPWNHEDYLHANVTPDFCVFIHHRLSPWDGDTLDNFSAICKPTPCFFTPDEIPQGILVDQQAKWNDVKNNIAALRSQDQTRRRAATARRRSRLSNAAEGNQPNEDQPRPKGVHTNSVKGTITNNHKALFWCTGLLTEHPMSGLRIDTKIAVASIAKLFRITETSTLRHHMKTIRDGKKSKPRQPWEAYMASPRDGTRVVKTGERKCCAQVIRDHFDNKNASRSPLAGWTNLLLPNIAPVGGDLSPFDGALLPIAGPATTSEYPPPPGANGAPVDLHPYYALNQPDSQTNPTPAGNNESQTRKRARDSEGDIEQPDTTKRARIDNGEETGSQVRMGVQANRDTDTQILQTGQTDRQQTGANYPVPAGYSQAQQNDFVIDEYPFEPLPETNLSSNSGFNWGAHTQIGWTNNVPVGPHPRDLQFTNRYNGSIERMLLPEMFTESAPEAPLEPFGDGANQEPRR